MCIPSWLDRLTAHCTLHTAHCTLNTARCTLYTEYYTRLQPADYRLHTIHTIHTIQTTHCTGLETRLPCTVWIRPPAGEDGAHRALFAGCRGWLRESHEGKDVSNWRWWLREELPHSDCFTGSTLLGFNTFEFAICVFVESFVQLISDECFTEHEQIILSKANYWKKYCGKFALSQNNWNFVICCDMLLNIDHSTLNLYCQSKTIFKGFQNFSKKIW